MSLARGAPTRRAPHKGAGARPAATPMSIRPQHPRSSAAAPRAAAPNFGPNPGAFAVGGAPGGAPGLAPYVEPQGPGQELSYDELSRNEQAVAALNIEPASAQLKPIGWLNNAHYASLQKSNSLDPEFERRIEAYKSESARAEGAY